MFSVGHWWYLHRLGLVPEIPLYLGGAGFQLAGVSDDDVMRRELLDWGVLVSDHAGGVQLEPSRAAVFEAFRAPKVVVFGTLLLYRDRVVSASMPDFGQWNALLAPGWREMVPRGKFVAVATDNVASAALQFGGDVRVEGIDCAHVEPLRQVGRLLWEMLAPGAPLSGIGEHVVALDALSAASGAPASGDGVQVAGKLLSQSGVNAAAAEAITGWLGHPAQAAAQVCVKVRSDHGWAVSQDAAVGLIQFNEGAVLACPVWRADGVCQIRYSPATVDRWEVAMLEFVDRYRRIAAA